MTKMGVSMFSNIVTARAVPPSRMPSLKAPREEAIRCAIDLLAEMQPGTGSLTGWLVRMRDENGQLFCTIEVEEAELARQKNQ